MTLHVDGAPAPGGNTPGFELAPGETNGVCTAIPLPTTGQHRLALVVDEERAVRSWTSTTTAARRPTPARSRGPGSRTARSSSPTTRRSPPTRRPGATRSRGPATGRSGRPGPTRPAVPAGSLPVLVDAAAPDLRVGAVEVRHADGGRCVIRGRNTVAATIRNAGGTEAGPFAVELAVGGQRRDRASVGALAGGAERRVEIHNVPFFEGERSARVVADPDNTVKEGDEANNARDVELDCVAR